MLFTAATVLAFASAALAQVAGFDAITSPPSGASIAAGSTFEIDWEPTTFLTETVSIVLIGGQTQGTQNPLSTIAC
jgi:2-methylisocitrate lyase-like PEP mutase family enzyme